MAGFVGLAGAAHGGSVRRLDSSIHSRQRQAASARIGEREVEAFLTALATEADVAASTQNQALSALLFLYREVLAINLRMENIRRAKRPDRLPVVLAREEVFRLLDALEGVSWLVANLLYGSGLRLLEALRLRIQDGFRAAGVDGATWKGREGSPHDAAGDADFAAPRTDGRSTAGASHRHVRRIR